TPARRSPAGYLVMPAVLAGVLVALYVYVASKDLDTLEARSLNLSRLSRAVREHVQLTAVSTALTLLIAVPLGILLTRSSAHRIQPYLIALLTLGQAIPTIAILGLLAVAFMFLGFKAAITGLVLYAIVPVLLNTMVGLDRKSVV